MAEFYSRKPTRIPNFDYSSDHYYFITICTQGMRCFFGYPRKMNIFGEIAENDLRKMEHHFGNLELINHVIMPNHIHAIVRIGCDQIAGKRPNLSTVVGLYKSGVTRKIREIQPDLTVWQRSFHDHIIRNDVQFQKIWEYIENNPLQWELDCYYSEN